MTREKAVKLLARKLALFDKYEWQAHPTNPQARKQSAYEIRADVIVTFIEMKMKDWAWSEDKVAHGGENGKAI